MSFRAITANGDWTFGQGIAGYFTNEAAIEANVRTELQSWIGDCYWALQDGIDWIARLDYAQQKALMTELSAKIMQCYGVVGIVASNYTFDHTKRAMTIQFTIQTIFSTSFTVTLIQAAGQVGLNL